MFDEKGYEPVSISWLQESCSVPSKPPVTIDFAKEKEPKLRALPQRIRDRRLPMAKKKGPVLKN